MKAIAPTVTSVKSLRLSLGDNQEVFAKKTGYSQSRVSRMEEKDLISLDNLKKMLDVFGYDLHVDAISRDTGHRLSLVGEGATALTLDREGPKFFTSDKEIIDPELLRSIMGMDHDDESVTIGGKKFDRFNRYSRSFIRVTIGGFRGSVCPLYLANLYYRGEHPSKGHRVFPVDGNYSNFSSDNIFIGNPRDYTPTQVPYRVIHQGKVIDQSFSGYEMRRLINRIRCQDKNYDHTLQKKINGRWVTADF
jgi:transcriptional regulator with XRE-family HTH domain